MERERFEAAAKNEKWYFTGIACKRGHISRRQVSNGGCDECMHPGRNNARNQNARRDAVIAGALRYSTGQPCKWGHLAERWTSTGACVECSRPKSLDRQQMKRMSFVIEHRSLEFFESVLFALAREKSPLLLDKDIRTRKYPQTISSFMTRREYRVFPEHEAFLNEFAASIRAESVQTAITATMHKTAIKAAASKPNGQPPEARGGMYL